MRTYLICKPTKYSSEFSCAKCGRTFMLKTISRMEKCPRCNRKFKPLIKILRSEENDTD